MGRPGIPRSGTTQPTAHGSARRDGGDGRLDPVRWRRPGRGTLTRLAAVAILLVTAAVVSWSPPPPCSPTPTTVQVGITPTPITPTGSQPAAAPSPAVPDGRVGVPVRLADPTALALLRPGQRVDLLRLDGDTGSTPVATNALVLTVTDAADLATGGLLVALSPAEATRALGRPGDGFAVLIRPG